jgi:hypothetical protein
MGILCAIMGLLVKKIMFLCIVTRGQEKVKKKKSAFYSLVITTSGSKAASCNLFTDLGITTLVSWVLLKAFSPMDSRLFGKVILDNGLVENASILICLSVLGKVMLDILLPRKAAPSIPVTPSGITTLVK